MMKSDNFFYAPQIDIIIYNIKLVMKLWQHYICGKPVKTNM